MFYCKHCGRQNPKSARFCGSCAVPLSDELSGHTAYTSGGEAKTQHRKPVNTSRKKKGFLGGFLLGCGFIIIVPIILTFTLASSFYILEPTDLTRDIDSKDMESQTNRQEEYSANTGNKITYEDLKRNEEKYIGTQVEFEGKVKHVSETPRNEYMSFMISIYTGDSIFSDGDIYVDYIRPQGEVRVLEGDSVKLKGIFKGIGNPEVIGGASRPVIEASSITIH